jgi:cytochrome c-type biogenesis protein
MKLRILAAFLTASFLFASCGSSEKKQAPDFTLPSAQQSQPPVTLSALHRDTPVLLVFWATWCPTCVEEIPELNRLSHEYSEERLKIVAINVQESRRRVSRFMKEHAVKYPVILDETGEVTNSYGIVGLPVSVLLAKGGEILYYGFSLPPNLEQWLQPRSAK